MHHTSTERTLAQLRAHGILDNNEEMEELVSRPTKKAALKPVAK